MLGNSFKMSQVLLWMTSRSLRTRRMLDVPTKLSGCSTAMPLCTSPMMITCPSVLVMLGQGQFQSMFSRVTSKG
uniref:Uncharacterized protein n=1 Tax=Anguilla anguilla TaxID=7936 RepID=A0A0E9PTH5_ANGAN